MHGLTEKEFHLNKFVTIVTSNWDFRFQTASLRFFLGKKNLLMEIVFLEMRFGTSG